MIGYFGIFFISDSIVVPEEGSEESTNDPGGPEPEFIKLFKKRQERLKKSGMYVIFAECRYFAAMLLLLRCTILGTENNWQKEPLFSSTSSICVCNFTKNCSVLILKIQRSRFQYLWDYLLLYSKEDRPGDEMLQINSINITWFLIVHFKNII